MSIRYRPMRPVDVRECVEIVAAHPIVGSRYGSAIADLRPAWLRLIAEGFGTLAVFEETARTKARLLAIGASVFVSDGFMRELKTPPSFWIGPELGKRVASSDLSVLPGKLVQQANTHGGLNLVVWQATVRAEDGQRIEVWNSLMEAFLEYHRGYLLKELVAQAESIEHLMGMSHTGGFLWSFERGCYEDLPEKNLQDVLREPHIIGMTREMVLGQSSSFDSFGSWTGSLFLYEPPRFGFSRSEQRLLLSALDGGTDDELSDRLGLSLSMIKKTWRMIYERARACMPELIPGSQPDDSWPGRGREKKQLLLAYLRKHPEELRPVSRKLLGRNAAQGHSPRAGIRPF